MQICFAVILVLIALSIYLWRAKSALSARLARIGDEEYRRRHKEIFDNASDAIFVIKVAADGKMYFDSLNFAAVQAFDPDEIGFEGLCFEEIAERYGDAEMLRILHELSAQLEQAVAKGLPVKYESTFGFKSSIVQGTYVINMVPMADDGGIERILCFAQEVTARKMYEHALLERVRLEEKLSGFAASAPGFFYTYRHGADGSNAMPFASEGIGDLFGLRPEDVAQDISALSLRIHPDDLSSFIQSTAHSAAYLFPLSLEFRVLHPDRGELWVESRAMPKSEPDGCVVWHGFMHDVTERKLVESALRINHEHLAEAQRIGQMGSWELDLVSGALTWSEEIYRIFEIDPALFGASYDAFLNTIHPDDRAAVNKAYNDSLANHTPYSIDHRLLFADGRIKHVRECCETCYDETGKPLHSHGTVQDITALKVTEQQLQDTQDKLRELVLSREAVREGERKRIAWEMHEELGQLLAAAKMRVYGMRAQLPKDIPSLGEDSRVIVSLIDKSIKTIHDLVSDLRPTVLLHGIVPALEWLVAEFNKHPEIVCELSVDEAGEVVGDELTTLVFRVAQETLENIARYTAVSNVAISWKSDQGGHCLTIRHDGTGEAVDLTGDSALSFFGMQERITASGGEMRIYSSLEHGSVIEAIFPA